MEKVGLMFYFCQALVVSLTFARVYRPEFKLIDSESFDSFMSCPAFLDTNETSMTCIEVQSGIIKHSDCPQGFYCNWSIFDPVTTNCSETPHKPLVLECPKYQKEDKPCSASVSCHSGLYCDYTNEPNQTYGICAEQYLVVCSELHQCAKGLICHLNRCITQFSLLPGDSSESRIACASGLIQNGKCLPPVLTSTTNLPKPCTNDFDCLSKDGKTEGKCICIGNLGSYCKVHPSDQIYLNFLQAGFEDRKGEAHWYYERINYYPLFEFPDQIEEYLKSSLEFRRFAVVSEVHDQCGGFLQKAALFCLLLVNS